jgi:hypothetical protein
MNVIGALSLFSKSGLVLFIISGKLVESNKRKAIAM